MTPFEIVIDTNVLLAALRSNRGASHRLLQLVVQSQKFAINLSVPLVLEYEEVAKRDARALGLTYQDIDDVLDYLCSAAQLHDIFFLWRPFLVDPDDDMLLELAVEAGCQAIVTFNIRDFSGIEQFRVRAVTPREFLKEIGELP
jgi:putative PIN family toxin of toxin-antitoxin system